MAVGKTNGEVDLFTITSNPVTITAAGSFTPQAKQIVDMDFNNDNTKLAVCYSDDKQLTVVTTWAAAGRTTDQRDTGDNHVACKWSMNDDVAVADVNKKVKIFPVTGAGVINA